MILKWFNLCLKNYKNLVFAIYVVKKYIKLNLSVMVVLAVLMSLLILVVKNYFVKIVYKKILKKI